MAAEEAEAKPEAEPEAKPEEEAKPDEKAEEGSPLRKWMKAEDIYDVDIEEILSSQGVKNPEEDFKGFTEAQFEELKRKAIVERSKELKDQATKVRLEAKCTKLEKFWREQSGLKKTSINPDSKAAEDDAKAPSDQSSKAVTNAALEKASELKKFLMEHGCFSIELLEILSDHGVNKESHIGNISTNMEWGQVQREFRVAMRAKARYTGQKVRTDKSLKKFEKIWREKTGIKSTSIQETEKENEPAPKDKKIAELEGKGKALKNWMKKEQIWNGALYEELLLIGIMKGEQIKKIKQKKFDELVRKVKVERFKNIKDQKARKAAEKLLTKFEKLWKAASAVKENKSKKK